MTDQDLDKPSNLVALLDAATPELKQLPKHELIRRLVTRERVLELSARILSSWSELAPAAETMLAPEVYAAHSERAAGLTTRAWVHYAAEEARRSHYSDAQRRVREQLAERVRAHDQRLHLWAMAVFQGNAQAEQDLAEIARGYGRSDDAADVVSLVTMFRHAHQQGVDLPLSKEELDAAEAAAKQQLDLLAADPDLAARRLAAQAFTLWHRDYTELMALGRYLARGNPAVMQMFPGVRMAPTGRSLVKELKELSEPSDVAEAVDEPEPEPVEQELAS